MNETIQCELCGEGGIHYIPKHLEKAHHNISVEGYQKSFPNAPLTSATFDEAALAKKNQIKSDRATSTDLMTKMMDKILPTVPENSVVKRPMHEVFELPLNESTRAAPRKNGADGAVVMIDVLDGLSEQNQECVPEVDANYVFSVDGLKDILLAIHLNMPVLLWGFHGTGKTALAEQVCARLNRPFVRVQHTDTTEESHILGQMVVRNGGTEFDFGPLAEAMVNGWVYLADEYDFAHPGVIAVYQPVLEGKPLYIKEAPPGQRLIKPHPHFRFIATGNTNGSGDDTGLYSGTKIGNAASYSRFGVTIQVNYPSRQTEISILRSRVGINQDMAEKLVSFAETIRTMYEKGEISLPVSPREMINAAALGVMKGGIFRHGIDLAYANRLDATQGEAVKQTAQRVFG
jgi:cobaltochelatase CobS